MPLRPAQQAGQLAAAAAAALAALLLRQGDEERVQAAPVGWRNRGLPLCLQHLRIKSCGVGGIGMLASNQALECAGNWAAMHSRCGAAAVELVWILGCLPLTQMQRTFSSTSTRGLPGTTATSLT